jgi:hypothetical protein
MNSSSIWTTSYLGQFNLSIYYHVKTRCLLVEAFAGYLRWNLNLSSIPINVLEGNANKIS